MLTPNLRTFGKLEIISEEKMCKGPYRYCGSDEDFDFDIYELEDNGRTTGKYFAVRG